MGTEVDVANIISKAYAENQEQLVKAMAAKSLRISHVPSMQYKLSYLMSSSETGKNLFEASEGEWQ